MKLADLYDLTIGKMLLKRAINNLCDSMAENYSEVSVAIRPEVKNTVLNPNGSIDVFFKDPILLPVNIVVGEKTAEVSFYVKVRIRSKKDFRLIFITDHLVTLKGTDNFCNLKPLLEKEILNRLEGGDYDVISIEKINVAMDQKPFLSNG